MLDTAPAPAAMQRANGRAAAGFAFAGGRTRLARLHQSGCAKVMLPRVPGPPEVVFLNTAGGLTGGDRLAYELSVEPGGQLTGTTQTAERAYASAGGEARVEVKITAGAGATLDWLPQETILFDRAALDRTTRIDIAGDTRLTFCETLVLGRAAMGETVRSLSLTDRRSVWRDGVPVLIDPVRIDDACLVRRDEPALLGSARAVALVGLVSPGAEDALEPVRALIAATGVAAQASAWDGRCLVRMMAPDAWPLRRALVAVLTQFRGSAPPRVWQI